MKKIWSVFQRDLRSAFRDPMGLWLLMTPIIIAVIIVAISPGISDSALSVAMLGDADPAQVGYFENFAKVTQYDSLDAIEERVGRRDDTVGIVASENGTEIVMQGDEPAEIEDMAKTISALYELGAQKSDSRMTLYDFGQRVPPLKKILASSLMLMITVLSGMMITMGIVDEKTDDSIRASNVTPLSQPSYIIGKSLIGIFTLLLSAVASLLILGFWDIDWLQMLLVLFSASLLSMVIAFTLGVVSSDFIEAAGSLKVLMLPLAASVLVYELVSPKWQWTVWWNPFYWAFKGADEIINGSSEWPSVLLYTAIVLVIAFAVYLLLAPKIRKGLN